MIDIHSHILPGLDDGPETLQESVAMLEMAAAAGTTDIVATPHADLQYRFDYDLVSAKIAELRQASQAPVRIHRGCDFHLHFDNIQDALAHPGKYAINNQHYVLVEFSELLIPNTTDDIFRRMISAGMTPVVTHPERNPLLMRRMEQLESWVTQGILIQVTGQSFLGHWGREAQASADELMKRNRVHFVASDAHDAEHRPPVLTEAFAYVEQKWGKARAQALFIDNPGTALEGGPIDQVESRPEPEPRRWYQFWH